MASTYSPNLRIQLIPTGDQSNTWGDTTNVNLGTLIEQAIAGYISVSVTSGDVVLSHLDGVTDQSRQMVIELTGTPGTTRTVTAPAVGKVYTVFNNSNASVSFIALGGTGVTLIAGAKKYVYCNGTNFYEAGNALTVTSGTIDGTTIGATTATSGKFTTINASGQITSTVATSTAPFVVASTTAVANLTASNVTTNANLTGAITSVGNATILGTASFTSANLAAALTDETGTGASVFATSPTLVTPALGTPSALVGTNITGTATAFTASNVTTNANLTGAVTSIGNASSLGSFTSLQLATALTDETGTGASVFATSPTLVTPALGTPSALVGTNITGTATAFTASNVTTNANLTGAITSVGNATVLGTSSFTSANLAAALTDETGTGANVFATSPILVTPALGTPSALVGTNITGTATAFTASNVTTNANLTGDITSVGNATTLTNAPVIAKVLTGYVSGAGTVAATDSILQAIQKLNGNNATNANLTGMVTSVGNATTVVTNANLTGDITSVGNATTLTNAPVIAKVLTGYVSGAGTVAATDSILQAIQKLNGNNATNANLTGAVTSIGNATSLGSFTSLQLATALTDETGTGANVFATSPTLVTPALGTPSALVGTNISGTAAFLTAGAVTNGVYTNTNNTFTGTNRFPVGVGINAANPYPTQWGLYARASGANPAIMIESAATAANSVMSIVTYDGSGGTAAMQFFWGTTATTYAIVGSIQTTATATSYLTSSDYRLKENVTSVANAIDRAKLLKPCNFTWIQHPDTPAVDGFIAHELAEVIPVATTGTKDAVDEEGNPIYQGIDQAKIVPLLTAALQEAITRIEALEARLA